MTTEECIFTLRGFNAWRRGADKEMLDVKSMGLAIDMAIGLIEQRAELIDVLVEVLDKIQLSDSTLVETPTATKARAVMARMEGFAS